MEKQAFYIYGDCKHAAGFAYDYEQPLQAEGLKPLYKLTICTFWNGEQRDEWASTKKRFVDDEWIEGHPSYYGRPVFSYGDFNRANYGFY